MVDLTPIHLGDSSPAATSISASSLDCAVRVAWVQNNGPVAAAAEVWTSELNLASGAVAPGINLTQDSVAQTSTSMSCAGARCLVTWSQGFVAGAYVGYDGGALVRDPIFRISSVQYVASGSSVAGTSASHVVLFTRYSSGLGTYLVAGTLVYADGGLSHPNGSSVPLSQVGSAIAFDGLDYRALLGHSAIPGVRALTISPAMAYGAPTTLVTAANVGPFAIDCAPDAGCLSVFENNSAGGIVGVRQLGVGASAAFTAPFTIAGGLGDQASPAVAWNGSEYLVVWSENRAADGGYDLFGTRIQLDGGFADPPGGFPIHAGEGNQRSPAVACHSGVCLVTWSQ